MPATAARGPRAVTLGAASARAAAPPCPDMPWHPGRADAGPEHDATRAGRRWTRWECSTVSRRASSAPSTVPSPRPSGARCSRSRSPARCGARSTTAPPSSAATARSCRTPSSSSSVRRTTSGSASGRTPSPTSCRPSSPTTPRQQRYAFVGPVTVAFEEAEDLDTGVFRVRSATAKGRPRNPQAAAAARRARRPPAAEPQRPAAPPQIRLDVDGRRYRRDRRGHRARPRRRGGHRGRRPRRLAPARRDPPRRRPAPRASTSARPTARSWTASAIGTGDLADGSRITVGRTRIVVRLGQW